MTDFSGPGSPRLSRGPFILGDVALVGVALIVYAQGQHWPFGTRVGLAPWEGWVFTVCLFLGATLGVLPYLLEYRAWSRAAELDRIDAALKQVKGIEQVGRQINSATAGWQAIQDDASKAVHEAEALAQRMTAEGKAFQEFLQRANDSERAHLRLEVEKLRRAEGEWLQAMVRILDHVWALYQAAVRSGRVHLVEQLSHFQRACRDAGQRLGLVPFVAARGETFNDELHQPAAPPAADIRDFIVAETLATGFRFQGQTIRKALVTFKTTAESSLNTSNVEPEPSSEDSDSAEGPTEFARDLASDFQESADTEFVQAISGEDVKESSVADSPWPPVGNQETQDPATDRPGAA